MVKITNYLRYIKNIKGLLILAFLITANTIVAQNKIKIDGVAVVVGKNIVLDSDIEKFRIEVEQRSEGKIKISDCEMLEEIMTQKLIAHHAVIDSIIVTEDEVLQDVEKTIANFKQQLGSIEKVIEFYGFNDEEDLVKELSGIQEEQKLIQREQASITEKVDVTPEEVRTYYNNLKKDDNLPEFGAEIELAQLVMYAEPTKEETDIIIEKLNGIKKEVEEGASMRMKSILYSEDPGVTENAGLYTITRESPFVKEFKEAAFSLEEGEVSEPFKSPFGYHIIKLEKVRGQEIDARHLLLQPKISQEELLKAKEKMDNIRQDILDKKMTFEEAVIKYSEDDDTKNNKGLIINPYTNDTRFELTRMDPNLYERVNNLAKNGITETFFDQTREGEKMFKIILMRDKILGHTANYVDDYVKIQKLALQKKQEEVVEKWAADKIKDTYIKISESHKQCEFKYNWQKK